MPVFHRFRSRPLRARLALLGLAWLMLCAAGMPVAAALHALGHLPTAAAVREAPRLQAAPGLTDAARERAGDGTDASHCDQCAAFDAFEAALLPDLPVLPAEPPRLAATGWTPRITVTTAARWFEPRAPPLRQS